MATEAKLTLLFPGHEEEINIFIHGYNAVRSSNEFEELAYYILRAKPRGKIYLLYWKSGNWNITWVAALPKIIYRIVRFSKITNPYALAGDVLMIAGTSVAHYIKYMKHAEKLGTQLKQHICEIPNVKKHKINLIGHSLGARIIHHALSKNNWSDYQIHDCVFLGGSAEADADDWHKCAKEIKGKFYNAFSKKDKILMIKAFFKRKQIGRHPINLNSTKVINRHYPSFGHTSYWPRLHYILPQLWSNYKASSDIPNEENLPESTDDMFTFVKNIFGDTGETVMSWTNQQFSGWYDSLSNAISSSKAIMKPTGKTILENVSSAYESSAKNVVKVKNPATIFTNALLASDFSRNMGSWLEDMFNKGVPSIYDKSVDAVYNTTYIGGGHLHRLFDGSHTLWGMWDKVREASPDDTFLQEAVGYTTALSKDLTTHVGIPLFTWSKSSYDQVADALSTTFGISKPWFSDLLHVNAVELIGTSVSTIAIALDWNKKQVKEFASLAGSLGIASIASANPALGVVTLVALSKSLVDAGQKGDYMEVVNGLAKGGVGTGVFLATSSAIGGPVWVGILTGFCIGAVVHKTMDTVDVSQITTFVDTSLRNAIAQIEDGNREGVERC